MTASRFTKLRGADPQQSRTQDNIASQVDPISSALRLTPIMGAPVPSWIPPNLTIGFANTGGALASVGYHMDALHYVHMQGSLTHAAGTAAGSTIFTLPAGYRPQKNIRLAVRGTAGAAQFVTITNAGIVQNGLVLAAGGTIDLAVTFLGEI